MRRLVAMTGRAGSGKSAAARRLVLVHGFERVRFAGPLRKMLYAIGLTEAHTDGKLKELPCDLLCGRTPRQAMQTLGTEWGRELGADFWIRAWRAELDALPATLPVVVDDCRFPNEAAAIVGLKGEIVRVERPGQAPIADGEHVSEAFVATLPATRVIENSGSVEDLYRAVDALAAAWAAAP